jgi:hypothetical protein
VVCGSDATWLARNGRRRRGSGPCAISLSQPTGSTTGDAGIYGMSPLATVCIRVPVDASIGSLKDGAPFVIADIWESVYNAANARRRQQNHSRRSPAEVAIFTRITGGSTYWERT